MKNYDEMFQKVLARREEYEKKKKKRTVIIKRTAAAVFGTAAVLGIGLTTYVLRPPKKPTPNQSGIIAETETTSAETTTAPTSSSTAAPQTVTTEQTTVITALTTVSSALSTTATVHTTATAARTTRNATATTVTSTAVTTQNVITTTLTTTENGLSGRIPPDGPKSEYEIMLEDNFSNLELMKGFSYSVDCYYAEDAQVGEYLFELQLKPTVQTDRLPPSITAKVYEFKNSVHEYQLIVKFEGSEKNYPYVNFDYLRQIINNTKKEESL